MCHTYGDPPLFSAISRLGRVSAEDLPLHLPPKGNMHILLLLPIAMLPGREVALQNLCSETALLPVFTEDFHYGKNCMQWAWSCL